MSPSTTRTADSRVSGSLAPALTAAAALLAAGPLHADTPNPMNRVDFQVERSREVANDWATAVVGVTDEDRDPAALADRINRAAAWGLETAGGRKGIRVESGGYSTRPINDPKKGQIRLWRASQDLVLETGDAAALSDLLGELQARLELRSIEFSVSPTRRREVEEDLISEALAAFQARAESVRSHLGASGYKLVHLSIQTPGRPSPIRPMRSQMMAAEDAVAAPALASGTSTLSVHVNGTVELE